MIDKKGRAIIDRMAEDIASRAIGRSIDGIGVVLSSLDRKVEKIFDLLLEARRVKK